MFLKLILFFLIVFVTAYEYQTDYVQSFISSGEKEMAELEKQYSDFAANGSYDEQKLRQLMLDQIEWRTQVETLRNQLQIILRVKPGLTADERAILQSDIDLLTAAYSKVFLALHLNIHVIFDHVQFELLHILDDIQSNDIESLKNKYNSTLTSLKAVTEDIKVQGGKFLDDVKGIIAVFKQAKNQTQVEFWQYLDINDSILHVMSELSLEKANIQNQLRKAQRLSKYLDPRKKDVLLYLVNGLKEQSDDLDQTMPRVEQRLQSDL